MTIKGRFITARWPWTWLLKATGMYAITMPWGAIHVLEGHEDWDELRAHELIHIAQINRDGPVTFSLRYLWGLVTRGYRNISYEQEAYAMGFGGGGSKSRKQPEDAPVAPTTGKRDPGIGENPQRREITGDGAQSQSLIASDADKETKSRKLRGKNPTMLG